MKFTNFKKGDIITVFDDKAGKMDTCPTCKTYSLERVIEATELDLTSRCIRCDDEYVIGTGDPYTIKKATKTAKVLYGFTDK